MRNFPKPDVDMADVVKVTRTEFSRQVFDNFRLFEDERGALVQEIDGFGMDLSTSLQERYPVEAGTPFFWTNIFFNKSKRVLLVSRMQK